MTINENHVYTAFSIANESEAFYMLQLFNRYTIQTCKQSAQMYAPTQSTCLRIMKIRSLSSGFSGAQGVRSGVVVSLHASVT